MNSLQELITIFRHLTEGQAKLTGWYLEWKYAERTYLFVPFVVNKKA